MNENQILEKIGIVKAIMPSRVTEKGTWYSFTLKDFKQSDGVKDIFISSKKVLEFQKGDEIKIKYTVVVGEVYTNYYLSSSEVVKKENVEAVTPTQSPQSTSNNVRNTGNVVSKVAFFKTSTEEELVNKLNIFNESNNVFATQTHYTTPGWTAFVYYKTF